MFRLVATTMAVNDQARRALNKRPPQRIHALHHQGHSLHNPRTAPLAQFLACIHCVFRNHIHMFDCFAAVSKTDRLRSCLKLTASRSQLQSMARSLPNSSISRRLSRTYLVCLLCLAPFRFLRVWRCRRAGPSKEVPCLFCHPKRADQ